MSDDPTMAEHDAQLDPRHRRDLNRQRLLWAILAGVAAGGLLAWLVLRGVALAP